MTAISEMHQLSREGSEEEIVSDVASFRRSEWVSDTLPIEPDTLTPNTADERSMSQRTLGLKCTACRLFVPQVTKMHVIKWEL